MIDVTAGEVWWHTPPRGVGREQVGHRPVVVVSGEEYHDAITSLFLGVPVTTTDRGWPNHVRLSGVTALTAPSWAMTEQVAATSRDRLTRRIGIVDHACLTAIRGWILDHLR